MYFEVLSSTAYPDVQRPSSTISHRTLQNILDPNSEDASPVKDSGSDEDARSRGPNSRNRVMRYLTDLLDP